MYKHYNPNPKGRSTGDCVPRAISVVLGCDWDTAYLKLVLCGFEEKMMPSSNFIHDKLLRGNGFQRFTSCPGCLTVKSFADRYTNGTFLLGTGDHVVGVINGDWFDSWDSGSEEVLWIYKKEDVNGVQ